MDARFRDLSGWKRNVELHPASVIDERNAGLELSSEPAGGDLA